MRAIENARKSVKRINEALREGASLVTVVVLRVDVDHGSAPRLMSLGNGRPKSTRPAMSTEGKSLFIRKKSPYNY